MLIKLFDIQDNKVIPSEHCYTITWLKNIMEEYAEDEEYLKVFTYIHYMTHPSPDVNPFHNLPDLIKADRIYQHLDCEFSLECEMIIHALKNTKELFETPTVRMYNGVKSAMDKLAKYLETHSIDAGRDGNIKDFIAVSEKYPKLRDSFKLLESDLEEENKTRVRGDLEIGYDQEI